MQVVSILVSIIIFIVVLLAALLVLAIGAALSLLFLFCIFYIFAVMGRKNHPGLEKLRGWKYTHRGLHNAQRPENSLAAFRAAVEKGYGSELDIHLLKDGELAVIHDHSLLRNAGVDVQIEELTSEELKNYHLDGTEETIPTFRQVLDIFEEKAPLIVELKAINGNHCALVDAAVAQLKDYKGVYCIESFDPRCIQYLKKQYPDIIRGQLTENFMKSKAKAPWYIKLLVTLQLENFLIMPDFVAYKFADRKNPGMFLVRKLWGVQGVTWTLKTPEEFAIAEEEGWIPIFEGFDP